MASYQMPDGNTYEFKDDADASAAMDAWQTQFGGEAKPEPAAPVNPMGARPNLMPQEEMTSTDKWLASRKGLSSGVEQGIADFLGAAASTGTGALNIVGSLFGKELDRTKVRGVTRDPSSWSSLAGSFADPAAAAIGGAAGKVAGAVLPRAIPAIQGALGGALGGGAIGALSEDGDATTGALAGGAFGAVLPVAAKLTGKVIDTVRGTGADVRAGRILREAGGVQLENRLKAAPANVNVAQAYGQDAPAALSAMQRFASKQEGTVDMARRMAESQAAARQTAMGRVAGGGSAEEAAVARQLAQKRLAGATNPERVANLDTANLANQVRGQLEPLADLYRANAGKKYLNGESITNSAEMREVWKGASEIIEGKIGSLEKNGLRPLTADPILTTLRDKLSKPGDRATSLVQKVLGGIDDAITTAAKNNGGVLDAYDLHAIRKYEINSVIDNLLKDASKSDKARAGRLADDVKGAIDEAISNAGGIGWKDYLSKYSMGMRSIDKMAMAQATSDLSDRQLIKLVAGDKPKMVSKVFGPAQQSFTGAMGAEAAPFQRAAGELSRDIALKESAKQGSDAAGEILNRNLFTMHLPNLLRQDISLMNRAMEAAGSRINKGTVEKLSKAMYNPSEALRIIGTLPLSERNAILSALQNSTVVGAGAGMLTGATQ